MRKYAMRAFLGIALTIFMLFHVIGITIIPYVDRLEQIAYDTRVRLTMSNEMDPRIVIVDIDERSLSAEGQWPWRRDKIALLVEKLFDEYSADLVAFDVLFAEPQESHDISQIIELASQSGDSRALATLAPYVALFDRDRRLAEVIKDRRVVLGYFFHTDQDFKSSKGNLPDPVFTKDGSDFGLFAPRASGYTANLAVLQASAIGAGFYSNPLVDSDGVYRRVPLLHEYAGGLYESLSLSIARNYLGLDLEPGLVEVNGVESAYPRIESLFLGPIEIPIDSNGAVLVPYSSRSPGFPYVSATDVLHGEIDDAGLIAGSIVMVGTSAAGLVDLRPTPIENVYPGVEIHASAVSGILDETIKWSPTYTLAAEIVGVVVLGLAAALILPLLSPIYASIATWLLIGGDTGVNLYIWKYQSHLMPLMTSLLLVLGIYVMNMFYGFFFEARTRAQLRSLFGQYIPPEIVDEMNKDPGRYTLESKKKELTVLFTDVRGFTTISESLEPDELAELMNEFLTPMTRIVHKNKGTIDKYMGDAMMAFWGAPIEAEDHAARGVAAALEMVAAVESLNPGFAERGWPPVRIGVGLNTGPMNVGNMGSEFRMAYTVLGDAVNLGSRLEGLTKQYGVSIIVSETTKNSASGYLYRELDLVRVKGKTEPIGIFEPVSPLDDASDDDSILCERLGEGISLYRRQRWDEAQRAFRELGKYESQQTLCDMYLSRIDEFRRHPPPDQWDGVFTFDTK